MSQSDFFKKGSHHNNLVASLKKINTTGKGYRSCHTCLSIGFHAYGRTDTYKKTMVWFCSALCLQKDKINMHDWKDSSPAGAPTDMGHVPLTLDQSMKEVIEFLDTLGWSKSFKDLSKDELYSIIYNFYRIFRSHEGQAFAQFNKPKLDQWFSDKYETPEKEPPKMKKGEVEFDDDIPF